MKKNIVLGSILAVVLMMMLPVVAATEANTIQTAVMQPYALRIPEIDIQSFQERNDDDPSTQTVTLITLLILLLRAGIVFLQFLRAGSLLLYGAIIAILIKLKNRPDNMTAFII